MIDRDYPGKDRPDPDSFNRVTHDMCMLNCLHLVRGGETLPAVADGDVVVELPEGPVTFGVVGMGKIAIAEEAHVIVRSGEDPVEKEWDELRGRLAIAEVALGACQKEIAGLHAENKRLRAESLIDPKTQLGSERALTERYERLNEAIRIDRTPPEDDKPVRPPLRFTFVYIDFDGFGDINTAVGHPTADRLLGKLGPQLKAAVRPEDDIYRKGGDEGIVIMIDQELETEDQRTEFKRRIDRVGKEAFEELAAELLQEGRHEEVANLRRIALVGYSVGIAVYDRTRHRNVKGVESDADFDLFEDKYARKTAVGIDPSLRSNVLPSDPMVGVLHARHHA